MNLNELFKWSLLILFAFFAEKFITISWITLNFSFLLIYLFVIEYFFPKSEQKKLYSSDLFPVIFFIFIGIVEDFFQGIIGPAIVSKTLTGLLLTILARQLFFHWTELFKASLIFLFTILDEAIYSFIVIYFFNFKIAYLYFLASLILKGLVNVPIGLILSWRKP